MSRREFLRWAALAPAIGALGFRSNLARASGASCRLDGEKPTFQNFIRCRSNGVAHSEARLMSSGTTKSFNALVLFGDAGMGKSHLTSAMIARIHERLPGVSILEESCDRLIHECHEVQRLGRMSEFRRRRLECEYWILDNMNIVTHSDLAHAEFQQIFAERLRLKRPTVLTSQLRLNKIRGLSSVVVRSCDSQLQSCLDLPDPYTRLVIARQFIMQRDLGIPDAVARYVAEGSQRSVRELEGNLLRLAIHSDLNRTKVTAELARKIMSKGNG